MSHKKVTISFGSSKSRAQLAAWSQMIKRGVASVESMQRTGIKDLDAIIVRAGWCNEENEDEIRCEDEEETEDKTNVGGTTVDEIAQQLNEIVHHVTAQEDRSEEGEEANEKVKTEDQTDASSKTMVVFEECVPDLTESGYVIVNEISVEGGQESSDRISETEPEDILIVNDTAMAGDHVAVESTTIEEKASEDLAPLINAALEEGMSTVATAGEQDDDEKGAGDGDCGEADCGEAKTAISDSGSCQGETTEKLIDTDEQAPLAVDEDAKDAEKPEDAGPPKEVVHEITLEDAGLNNALVALIEWLLTEAAYCSHMLLMSGGNLVVASTGQVEKTHLWTPLGHDSLTESDHPTEAAAVRVRAALKALYSLKHCQSTRPWSSTCNEQYRLIVSILSAINGGDDKIERLTQDMVDDEHTQSTPAVESFYQTIAEESGNQDMHLLRNGLPGYIAALDRLLQQLTGLHWNLNILTFLNEASNMICDFQQVAPMVENLAAAKKITDIRVSRLYLKLFSRAFGNLGFDDKKRIMKLFYEKHGPSGWHEKDQEFGANLTAAINKLYAQRRKKESIRKLAEEFCWFFMLSMKATWRRLLLPTDERGQAALKSPVIIPVIIDILRLLPPVVDLKTEGGERLLLAGIRTFAKEINEDTETNWIYLVRSLLSEKMVLKEKDGQYVSGLIAPIVDKTEGVATTVLPLLQTHPKLAMETLSAVLDDGKWNSIQWTGEVPPTEKADKWNEGDINVAKLTCVLADIYLNSKKRPIDGAVLEKLSLNAISLLNVGWKNAGVTVTPEAIKRIENHFETSPWPLRCWLFGYLRQLSNNAVRLPVPKCLLETMKLPEELFKPIDCDDWSPDHAKSPCALQSLFKMVEFPNTAFRGIIDSADVSGLVQEMKAGKFSGSMVDALVATLNERNTIREWRQCMEMLTTMFDWMKEEIGVSVEDAFLPTDSRPTGISMIAPLTTFCEAVTRIIRKTPAFSTTYVRNFTTVCNDSVVERLLSSNDKKLKFAAWFILFGEYSKLVRAVGRKSGQPETNDIVRAISESMNRDVRLGVMASFDVAADYVGSEMKEMILKDWGPEQGADQ